MDLVVRLEAAERRADRLGRLVAVLSHANDAAARATSGHELLEAACRIAVDDGGLRMAWVGMVDRVRGRIGPIASAGTVDGYLDGLEIPLDADPPGPTASAALTGRHVIVDDIARDPRMAPWRDAARGRGFASSGAFPLVVHGDVAYTLNVYADVPGFFGTDELRLLDELAGDIGYGLTALRSEHRRRELEQDLAMHEVLLREAFEDAAIGMAILDVGGAFRQINVELARILDAPRDQLTAGTLLDYAHPDDRRPIGALLADLRSGSHAARQAEQRLVRPDGTIVWTHLHAAALQDRGGTVNSVLVQVIDVTARRRSQRLLTRQAQVLELVARQEPLGDILAEVCRLVDGHADLHTAVLLHTEGRLVLGSHPSLPTDVVAALADRPLAAAPAGEEDPASDVTVVTTADHVLHQHAAESGFATCWSVPIRSRTGAFLGTVVAYGQQDRRPTTAEVGLLRTSAHLAAIAIERQQAAALLQAHADELERANAELVAAARTKDDFLSMTSHELRTPLTPLTGLVDTLLARWAELDDDRRLELLGVVDRHAHRMVLLVDDLLTMSQANAGELRPVRRTIAVRAMLDAAVAALHDHVLDVAVSCPENLRATLDPIHLHQILTNLLTNASKYGGDHVHIEARTDADRLRLRVCDDGPGVDPAFVPHLFEAFRQADRGDRRTSKGTGLGLTVVRTLVAASGGAVWYEPGEPGGACFVVDLPGAVTRRSRIPVPG